MLEEEERERVKIIPSAERTAILKAAESDLRMKTAITVLMFTGMRIGDAYGMSGQKIWSFQMGCVILTI